MYSKTMYPVLAKLIPSDQYIQQADFAHKNNTRSHILIRHCLIDYNIATIIYTGINIHKAWYYEFHFIYCQTEKVS